MTSDPFDGRRLADALRTGQPALMRAAFGRHIEAMTLLARSLAGGSDVAADRLVETAWSSVTADFRRNPPRGSARAWLFTRLLKLRDPAPDAGISPLDDDQDGPEFLPADDPWEGHWTDFPAPWRAVPDAWESSAAGRAVVMAAVATLPLGERVVLILRDLDGWTPSEVGALTGLLPDEQRDVLLRARLKIRGAMDLALRASPSPAPPAEADAAAISASATPGAMTMAESPDLTCQVAVELLPRYLDDDLPEAQAGRLLALVDGWPEAGPAFIADCAARLAELFDWAKENQDRRATRMLRAYVKETAEDTDPASVSYTVAHAAGIVGWLPGEGLAAKARGERTPFDAERRRQGRWLAGRLGLAG